MLSNDLENLATFMTGKRAKRETLNATEVQRIEERLYAAAARVRELEFGTVPKCFRGVFEKSEKPMTRLHRMVRAAGLCN